MDTEMQVSNDQISPLSQLTSAMSYERQQDRVASKQKTVMFFLENGEAWTSLAVVAELLKTSEKTALKTVRALVAVGRLTCLEDVVKGSQLKLYGIPGHELTIALTDGNASLTAVQQYISAQLKRIKGASSGWSQHMAPKVVSASALAMTYEEKQARAQFKRKTLMAWLASGEVWTTLSVAADLLQISERTALRLLQSMVKDNMLKCDSDFIVRFKLSLYDISPNLKLYGLTAHGLAVTESAHPNCREFNLGRTSTMHIQHHLNSQLIRIKAERAGWTDWVPGKILYLENKNRGKKIVDSIARRSDHRLCAFECELNIKSAKRNAGVLTNHLIEIMKGAYDIVYYIVPDKKGMERAFERVKFVVINGDKVSLNETHRARFKVFDSATWKGEL